MSVNEIADLVHRLVQQTGEHLQHPVNLVHDHHPGVDMVISNEVPNSASSDPTGNGGVSRGALYGVQATIACGQPARDKHSERTGDSRWRPR